MVVSPNNLNLGCGFGSLEKFPSNTCGGPSPNNLNLGCGFGSLDVFPNINTCGGPSPNNLSLGCWEFRYSKVALTHRGKTRAPKTSSPTFHCTRTDASSDFEKVIWCHWPVAMQGMWGVNKPIRKNPKKKQKKSSRTNRAKKRENHANWCEIMRVVGRAKLV